jgi:hypothetical protein
VISRLLNSLTFLAKSLPALQLGVSAGYCQSVLVGELEMIKTQIWTHCRSENGTLFTLSPHQ